MNLLRWLHSPHYSDLTTRQMMLLTVVCDDGPKRVDWLATHLGVSKPVVTRAHGAMALLGLVARRADPEDLRRCWIEATDKGRAVRAVWQ